MQREELLNIWKTFQTQLTYVFFHCIQSCEVEPGKNLYWSAVFEQDTKKTNTENKEKVLVAPKNTDTAQLENQKRGWRQRRSLTIDGVLNKLPRAGHQEPYGLFGSRKPPA